MIAKSKRNRKDLPPLQISCTSADCESGLHCFKKSREMSEAERGRCRYCGADLIDWDRVHQCNLDDVAYTFESLKRELVRHHYWHKPINLIAENHARRKGREGLGEAVRHRLEKYIKPPHPFRDGLQTPWDGNVIFYAQHALACCCRACMEYWHGIPKGIELSDEQVDIFVELIMMYIDERLPNLTEEGEKIPPVFRQGSARVL